MPQNKPIYEPETSALLDQLVGDEDVFFDVGANWGWYSVLIAARPTFHGTVHTFAFQFPLAAIYIQAYLASNTLGDSS